MYKAREERYESMKYVRCGRSGILLPRIALGFWHNFGSVDNFENQRAMVHQAFDLGITHFDLANNYGPAYGSAEENFGRIMDLDMRPYRDEMLISTKAGHDMWKGPYGDGGSRKYLMASLDQSLQRMRLDCAREKPCMWEFPNTAPSRRKKRLRSLPGTIPLF